MYPNSAISAGQMALIAVVAVVCVAIWIGGVFIAAREPRLKSNAEMTSLPQHPAATDESQRKAA